MIAITDIIPAAIKRRATVSFLVMIWLWFGGLCYKVNTIKNSQVGRYDSTKKTASQLTVDLVFDTDNNQTRGHSSLDKFFSRSNEGK